MIYQELLYSRSFSRDYRWMIVPPQVSRESLASLNHLYNLYDQHKSAFEKSPVLPLYCLNHPEATFLVSCGLSDQKDKDGRAIYCLQGICVAREYRRQFWRVLPRILGHDDGKGLLNRWKNIDFSEADDLLRCISKEYSFAPDHPDEPLAKQTQTGISPPPEKLPVQKTAYISFDKNGLTDLCHALSLYRNCTDFAFGATPEMTKHFPFKVIAKVADRSKRNKDMETITAESTPSPVHDHDQARPADERFIDPVNRFDPRRKKDHTAQKVKRTGAQKNLLRESGASRIVSRFLPRLLSAFKIGIRLKRQKSSDHQ